MIDIQNAAKSFASKDREVHALRGVSIHVSPGDIYGIIGFSGAGKSTLIRLVNRLEKPDSGTVIVDGQDLSALNVTGLRALRRSIGMVFQQFNLLNGKSVYHNVAIPLILERRPKDEIARRVAAVLKFVELEDKRDAYVSELSGGQKQRVGIARAIVTEPDVLLSDEATSALDPQTTIQILDLLRQINHKTGITILMITHELDAIKYSCQRMAVLEDGVITEQGDVHEIFYNSQSRTGALFSKVFFEMQQAGEVKNGEGI